jgi:hypothetical protein
MLLTYSTIIPRLAAQVESDLHDGLSSWLPHLALRATRQELQLPVPLDCAAARLPRAVISFLEPQHLNDTTYFPFCWHGDRYARLFPTLDGNLEILPICYGRTQLNLHVIYPPPTCLLSRIARQTQLVPVTAHRFLDLIRTHLLPHGSNGYHDVKSAPLPAPLSALTPPDRSAVGLALSNSAAS